LQKQENITGALFRRHTKAECVNCPKGITPSFFNTQEGTMINIENPEKQYPQVCFNYIHENPVKAGLVKRAEDWEFSSFRDYANI
jgi:putative transposase